MKVTVDGVPVAQERPRFRRFGNNVSTYDPPKSKAYKDILKRAWITKFGRKHMPIDVPLEIYVTAYRPIQKYISKKERLLKLANELLPVVKPDTDNYIKITLDGLNGVAFKDDNQITDVHAFKRYSDRPRLEIEIKELNISDEARTRNENTK